MFRAVSPFTLFVSCVLLGAYYALGFDNESPSGLARADLFGGVFVGLLGGFIKNLLGNNPGSTGATVAKAILNLQDGLSSVASGLRTFIGETRGWLTGLIGLFKSFKDAALLPLLRWLKDNIVRIKTWLRKMLGPAIDALLKIRKKLLEYYAKFVRPILDMIEIARFFLKTLDRLGVKWAGELEARLGKLESAIVRNFQTILGHLNRVIDVVDSVVTFELLFQRVPFLRTLRRDLRDWAGMFWRAQVKPLTLEERKDYWFVPSPPTLEERGKAFVTAIARGEGRYIPLARETMDDLRIRLEQLS